jgi:hypothetical protein
LIRTAITAEAYEAVAAMLAGSVGFEREPDDNGERLIWLERTSSTSCAPRGPGRKLQRRDPKTGGGGEVVKGLARLHVVMRGWTGADR